MTDAVIQFADPETRRTWQKVLSLAKKEGRYITRNRRKLLRESVLLAAILTLEYFIGWSFIHDLLLDGNEAAITAWIALIVPIAALTAHLLIDEGVTQVRTRLRAFAITGVVVLPVAMSLGLAVNLAANAVNYSGGFTGTIGGVPTNVGGSEVSNDVAGGIVNILSGFAPLLLVIAYTCALAISFYAVHKLATRVEILHEKVSSAVNRVAPIKALFEAFMAEYSTFEKEMAHYRRLKAKLPDHIEERFADELYVHVNEELRGMVRAAEYQLDGKQNIFAEVYERTVYIPSNLKDTDAARRRIAEIRDALRPHAVIAALGAAPIKEEF